MVELVFDNADGTIKGEYASYSEISVKRTVSRDGQSVYFLNGARCRRKDITDLFLGTGLGPRSYSIIEQGMISRIVEAKPEDIRVYLEEAAGISKYKERRRETENRIRHTRENLERLEDLREEVGKQIEHLKRQARQAEKYKELKEQYRLVSANHLTLLWQQELRKSEQQKSHLNNIQNGLEKKMAELRRQESDLETLRQAQHEQNGDLNKAQGDMYQCSSSISSLEQQIRFAEQEETRLKNELEHLQIKTESNQQTLVEDEKNLREIDEWIEKHKLDLEQKQQKSQASQVALQEVEQAMEAWRNDEQEWRHKSAENQRDAELTRSAIQYAEKTLAEIDHRLKKNKEEVQTLKASDSGREMQRLTEEQEALQASEKNLFEEQNRLRESISGERSSSREQQESLSSLRQKLHACQGEIRSLKTLQEVAGEDLSQKGRNWLKEHFGDKLKTLAANLEVEPGWELAVEMVLESQLSALLVPLDAESMPQDLQELAGLYLIADQQESALEGGLADKVKNAPAWVARQLSTVHCVESSELALQARKDLPDDQSIVTAEGLWCSRHSLRIAAKSNDTNSQLKREARLRELLKAEREWLEKQQVLQDGIIKADDTLKEMENQMQHSREQARKVQASLQQVTANRNRLESRQEQMLARLQTLEKESADLESRKENELARQKKLSAELESYLEGMASHEDMRKGLTERQESLMQQLTRCRDQASADQQQSHALEIEMKGKVSSRDAIEETIKRLQLLQGEQGKTIESNMERLLKVAEPVPDLRKQHQDALEKRRSLETVLQEKRDLLSETEQKIRDGEANRQQFDNEVSQMREKLQQAQLAQQSVEFQGHQYLKNIREAGFDENELLKELDENSKIADFEQQLEKLDASIRRLEPVNLAAIQEYEEQSERKTYLDNQHEDLIQALATLEKAMSRIDRETRTLFKDTFERVNSGMKTLFPKLFGGGHAYLELTGDDMLETGVAIMARPPGKRVSNIHLLSGGEKALTAVAMVFSIFQLNPAPFCMLDEVDAPLDDANVGRFSNMVRDMSETVQFIFVTHNKVTMEIAHQLSGVTMREPGVSRLVQVDLDEAGEMIDQG